MEYYDDKDIVIGSDYEEKTCDCNQCDSKDKCSMIGITNPKQEDIAKIISVETEDKHTDEGKPMMHLLPFSVLEVDARAYEYGLEKYGENLWRKGYKTSWLIDKALRHIIDYFEKHEDLDSDALDDGHLIHNLACARFALGTIIDGELTGRGTDDRYKE